MANNNEKFIITGVFDGSNAVAQAGKSADQINQAFGGRDLTGGLADRFGMINDALGGLGPAGVAAATVLSTAFAGVSAALDFSDKINTIRELSAAAGMVPAQFEATAKALKMTGWAADEASDKLKDINERFGEFRTTGTGALADVLKQWNIVSSELQSTDNIENLNKIVRIMKEQGATAEQVHYALGEIVDDGQVLTEVLGDNFSQYQKSKDAAIATASATDDNLQKAKEFKKASESLSSAWEDLSKVIGSKVIDAVTDATNKAATFLNFIKEGVKLLGGTTNESPNGLARLNTSTINGSVNGVRDDREASYDQQNIVENGATKISGRPKFGISVETPYLTPAQEAFNNKQIDKWRAKNGKRKKGLENFGLRSPNPIQWSTNGWTGSDADKEQQLKDLNKPSESGFYTIGAPVQKNNWADASVDPTQRLKPGNPYTVVTNSMYGLKQEDQAKTTAEFNKYMAERTAKEEAKARKDGKALATATTKAAQAKRDAYNASLSGDAAGQLRANQQKAFADLVIKSLNDPEFAVGSAAYNAEKAAIEKMNLTPKEKKGGKKEKNPIQEANEEFEKGMAENRRLLEAHQITQEEFAEREQNLLKDKQKKIDDYNAKALGAQKMSNEERKKLQTEFNQFMADKGASSGSDYERQLSILKAAQKKDLDQLGEYIKGLKMGAQEAQAARGQIFASQQKERRKLFSEDIGVSDFKNDWRKEQENKNMLGAGTDVLGDMFGFLGSVGDTLTTSAISVLPGSLEKKTLGAYGDAKGGVKKAGSGISSWFGGMMEDAGVGNSLSDPMENRQNEEKQRLEEERQAQLEEEQKRFEEELSRSEGNNALRLQVLREHKEREKGILNDYRQMDAALTEKHGKEQEARASRMFNAIAGIASMFGKRGAKIAKAAMIANAIYSQKTAIAKSWESMATAAALPFPANMWAMAESAANFVPIIAGAASAVAGAKSAPEGQFHSGITDVPKDGTYILQGGERVVDKRLNHDLKSYLYSNNSNTKGSGQPMVVQAGITIQGDVTGDIEDKMHEWLERNKENVTGVVNEQMGRLGYR